jgi:signal transduction histidine kinase
MTEEKLTAATTRTGEFRFEVDSGLLLQLGEQLVSKRSIALAELIKNAYDADAKCAIVEFTGATKAGGSIAIIDDGTGIPFDRMRDTWMRIATPDKVRSPVSEIYKRQRAGAKGIGRFAARRLASQLEVTSVAWVGGESGPKVSKEETTVFFDWDRFKPGEDVQSVPVRYEQKTVEVDRPTGVVLRLMRLRDTWMKEDIQELYRQLLRLIKPLSFLPVEPVQGKSSDPGFNVTFEAQEFPDISGALDDRFLSAAYATLGGRITEDGNAEYTLNSRASSKRRAAEHFKPSDVRFPGTGPTSFTLYFFPRRSQDYDDAVFSASEARRLGSEAGGVRIVMDQFQIPPYGEPGDDWLQLESFRARRLTGLPSRVSQSLKPLMHVDDRPLLLVPGNNQVFGFVALSRATNPQFKLTANRERLIEDDSFRQLREFVQTGIFWLTLMYAKRTLEERTGERKERKSPQRLLEQALESIDALPTGVAQEQKLSAIQAVRMAVQALDEEQADRITEVQMLKVLASTGTTIVVFDHQLLGVLHGLRESYETLKTVVRRLPSDVRRGFDQGLDRLNGWIDDAEHQAKLLGLLLGAEARKSQRRLAIRPIVQDLLASFYRYTQGLGFEPENDVPADLRTPPMFECELTSILVNLLTNSLKAVKLSAQRRIQVGAAREGSFVVIRVCDTGVGSNPDKWDDYFKPFVSDSTPDPILGTGTGLGLKIVKDFAEVYGGDARFIVPQAPWKTCVEVRLPDE